MLRIFFAFSYSLRVRLSLLKREKRSLRFSCYAVVNLRSPRISAGCVFRGLGIQALSLRMVGSNGLEPSTSRLSGVCSNQLSYEPVDGGGKRIRTDDPLLAGQVLYQLSYTPIYINAVFRR